MLSARTIRLGAASLRFRWKLRLCGISAVSPFCQGASPVLAKDGTIRIGRQLSVRGVIAPVEMGAVAGAHLEIGDKVHINQGASLVARRRIVIGDHSMIGDFSAIYDSNFHALEPGAAVVEREVVIGRNVWIGRGCTILPGSIIDDNAVIAAGSVVSGHVPPNVLMAGNPATKVLPLRHEDGWFRS